MPADRLSRRLDQESPRVVENKRRIICGTATFKFYEGRRWYRRAARHNYVGDIADTLDAVTTHGGQVITPPYPEGTLRVALFADPAGNVLGIWQKTSNSRGPR